MNGERRETERFRTDGGAAIVKLTRRQREVLDLVPSHLSNKEIAARLCITPHTLAFHLSNLYQKFGVHDRQALRCLACGKGRGR